MRTTSDPKEEIIKFRVNKDTKNLIENYVSRKDMTVSDYMRKLVESDEKNIRNI